MVNFTEQDRPSSLSFDYSSDPSALSSQTKTSNPPEYAHYLLLLFQSFLWLKDHLSDFMQASVVQRLLLL